MLRDSFNGLAFPFLKFHLETSVNKIVQKEAIIDNSIFGKETFETYKYIHIYIFF